MAITSRASGDAKNLLFHSMIYVLHDTFKYQQLLCLFHLPTSLEEHVKDRFSTVVNVNHLGLDWMDLGMLKRHKLWLKIMSVMAVMSAMTKTLMIYR